MALTRSPHGYLAGVCQGLADRFNIDPLVVRVIWIASVVFLGFGLIAYAILAIALPATDPPGQGERKQILGVCWALSRRTGWDVGLVRTGALSLLVVSVGTSILFYFILYFVLPDPGNGDSQKKRVIDLN